MEIPQRNNADILYEIYDFLRETQSNDPPPTARPSSQNRLAENPRGRFQFLSDLLVEFRRYNENVSDYIRLFQEILNQENNAETAAAAARPLHQTPRQNTPTTTPTTTAPPIIFTRSRRPIRPIRRAQENPLFSAIYTLFSETGEPLFEDVAVRPTEEQIRSATRILQHIDNGDNPRPLCPITLDPFENRQEVCEIVACGHIFSRDAIMNWFGNHVCCPVCRYDIRTDTISLPPQPHTDTPPHSDVNRNLSETLRREFTTAIQNQFPVDASFNTFYSFEFYQSNDDNLPESENVD
jgi:hypothetical protein